MGPITRHPHEGDPLLETSLMFSSSEIRKETNSWLQNIKYVSFYFVFVVCDMHLAVNGISQKYLKSESRTGNLFYISTLYQPIPVAARSRAWVCGRLLAGIECSNPAGGMDVSLL
jgi:hypothetical protein